MRINISKIGPNNVQKWDNLLFNAINASYRQSMAYEYEQIHNGRELETYIFELNGVDIAGGHYSIKKSYKGLISIADILSWFVFRENPNAELMSFLINHFTDWAIQRKAIYARINSWLPKIIEGFKVQYSAIFEKEIFQNQFIEIELGRHTYWIDITLSEELLLQKMKRQTRYKVRRGIRSELLIEKHDQFTNELFETFWTLYNNLGKHKSFNTLSKSHFKRVVFSLMNSRLANIFLIYCKGQIVNASFASNFGQAAYLYGAMNPIFKTFDSCTSPGQLAQ